jgi:hypothetical protein
MAGVDAVRGTGVWPRVRPVLRLVLVGCWVVWALAAWWTAPRLSSVEQARADAVADRIVAYQFAESFSQAGRASLWFTPMRLAAGDAPANGVFIWRTDFWRVHYAQLPPSDEPSPALTDVLPSYRAGTPIPPFAPVLATVVALVCLAILIQGPAPKLGTRWFWFVLGALPFGLGVLLWLRAERPWTEPEPPAPDRTTGQPKRYSGLTGLALVFLASAALSIVVALLRTLPEWLVPSALP